MGGYGRQVLGTVGSTVQLAASDDADFIVGGITFDWANDTAQASSPATYPDGVEVAVGEKAIAIGTVLYRHASGLYRKASDSVPTALVQGETVVANRTVKEDDLKSDYPQVLVGGHVWKGLLKVGAGLPTLAQLLAACPRLIPKTTTS